MRDREFSEEEVTRALERIVEEGRAPNSKSHLTPPGARLQVNTDAGTFECGSFFEAETVKGGKNYIIFMMTYNGWTYYMHGDRAKKIPEADFKNKINWGDLVPIARDKVDIEKSSLSVLSMLAMANGLSFNDYMKVIWGKGHGSEVPAGAQY